MDIYLDILLDFRYITVVGCREVDGKAILKLRCLNESIQCPHCGVTLEKINQTEEMLVRDLPVFGKPVYLQVPRRQFHCLSCQKFCTERLEFVSPKHHHTKRYEQSIYEQVKQSSLEEVSRVEGIGIATVRAIFEEQANTTIKKLRNYRNG